MKKVTFSTDNQYVNINGETYKFKEFATNDDNEVAFIYEKTNIYRTLEDGSFIPIKKLKKVVIK